MYRTGFIGLLCISCAPMQTTSTIQRTPAGDVELPATVTEISDTLDATTLLSDTLLVVTVIERRQCERKKIASTRIDTSTKSQPSRVWIALEATSTLAAGALLIGAKTTNCDGFECIGNAVAVSFYSSLFIGGVTSTTIDLLRGGTSHKQETKEQLTTDVFDCSRPTGAGIAVALRSPGTSQLQDYTDPSGRVTLDLGERRLPLELWIDNKPLRMISTPTRKP